MSESDADKKKNKLGYQRISVACSHCRRRKIRCVIADGDAHGRCQNCLRLNKECVFYPVEQQDPADKASSSTTSLATGTPSSSTMVSPQEQAAGPSFDATSSFSSFHTVPSNMPPSYPGMADTEMLPSEGIAQTEFGYQPPDYLRQWSAAEDMNPQVQAAMSGPVGEQPVSYWMPNPGEFAQNSPHDARSYSFPNLHDNRQWQTFQQQHEPGRSMSYGNMETSQHASFAASQMVYGEPALHNAQQQQPQQPQQPTALGYSPIGPNFTGAWQQMPNIQPPTLGSSVPANMPQSQPYTTQPGHTNVNWYPNQAMFGHVPQHPAQNTRSPSSEG